MPKTINTLRHPKKQSKPHHGFTLLELLVVVSLLGLLSLTAVALFDNAGDQDRFEATRSRLASIRTAIIGDTSRTLNGEPMLSGYVADMGRLPSNLKELIELGSQTAWSQYPIEDNEDVGVSITFEEKVYGGWRGPYLFGTPEASGTTFRDGWATETSPAHADDFDWNVTLTDASGTQVFTGASATTIAVQSYGSDRQASGTDYAEDYPASDNLLDANHWRNGVSSTDFVINFKVMSVSGVKPNTDNLQLRVYYFDDNDVADRINYAKSETFSFGASVTGTYTKVVSIDKPLAMGKFAYIVWCTNNASGTSLTDLYDGNCPTTADKGAQYITLTPNMLQPISINWTIP